MLLRGGCGATGGEEAEQEDGWALKQVERLLSSMDHSGTPSPGSISFARFRRVDPIPVRDWENIINSFPGLPVPWMDPMRITPI
jgi:hypothetical protein